MSSSLSDASPDTLAKGPILAIDTAGAGCSVALWDQSLLAERLETMARGQSERLFGMIAEALRDAQLGYQDLAAIAVTLGPGAFTGLRIGLAAAKGLAMALDIPATGVTSFEATAAAIPQDAVKGKRLAVLLESKRSDFYLQSFSEAGTGVSEARCVAGQDLAAVLSDGPYLLAGDAKERAAAFLASRPDFEVFQGDDRVRAAVVARIAAGRGPSSAASLAPLYLRPPDVTLPKNKKETDD